MLDLIYSLLIGNFCLIYLYSLGATFEKIFKINFDLTSKIVLGYSFIILLAYYLYFFLKINPNYIKIFLIILSFIIVFFVSEYFQLVFLNKINIFLNLILLLILIPALLYGEQFYIFRGNYWDSSSYLISGLLFRDYSFDQIISNNYSPIFNMFDNIDRITTGRPAAHYLLSLFLNTNFSIFFSYYLFKCFLTLIIFLTLTDLIKKLFNLNNLINISLSTLFIFSFWNIYIFEIDALSHYAAVPLLIFLTKKLLDLNEDDHNLMNYVIIGMITSGLFIIYPEIIIVPLIFFIMVFINKLKILSKKKIFYSIYSIILFFILTIPSLNTNYDYLIFSQVNQATRSNDWWGYFGSFILGKENLVLNQNFVEELKNKISNYSLIGLAHFVHTSHFKEKFYFIYLNILPSLSGMYYLLPGKIENNTQLFMQLFLIFFLNLYLLKIIYKNVTFIVTNKKETKLNLTIFILTCFFLIILFLSNKSYWSIIKLYTYIFPFIFIFFIIDFKKKNLNIVYLILVSFFCFYKYFTFNYGIGKYDSFPSIINPYLKKEINWNSISQTKISKCKTITFNEDNYIINTYLNLKILNRNDNLDKNKNCIISINKSNFELISD